MNNLKEFRDLNLNHSSNLAQFTRVKPQKREPRKTVGIALPLSLIEEARKNKLNISRICEQALQSILEYVEAQNTEDSKNESSKSFGEAFLQRKSSWAGSSAGMNARLALGRSRVQIPPGPPFAVRFLID